MRKIFLFILCLSLYVSQESISYGTTSNGRLENGVKLPSSGQNYSSYSSIGSILGRTYVNGIIQDITVMAYDSLFQLYPEKRFMYGETGLKNGGRFKPHKTHQNGLSVDFMVPVLTEKGKSIPLPTNIINKFGYSIEFDKNGKYDKYQIDFEAIGAHIFYLYNVSTSKGYGISKVIFDPDLQPLLFSTRYGDFLKKNITFSKTAAWVRHDEHYHIDFNVPTKPL